MGWIVVVVEFFEIRTQTTEKKTERERAGAQRSPNSIAPMFVRRVRPRQPVTRGFGKLDPIMRLGPTSTGSIDERNAYSARWPFTHRSVGRHVFRRWRSDTPLQPMGVHLKAGFVYPVATFDRDAQFTKPKQEVFFFMTNVVKNCFWAKFHSKSDSKLPEAYFLCFQRVQ